MKTSEQIDQLAIAIAAAQAEIKPAPKDATNPHFKSRYADLASIWEACQGPLSRHGLAVIQSPSTTPERLMRLTTRLMHKSGQWIEGELDIKTMKDDAQAIGSAITYARRYALAAMVGVVSEEDDDGNAASAKPKPSLPPQMQTPRPEAKVFFNKEKHEHKEWIVKKLSDGTIPDGMGTKVADAMHGKEFSKAVFDATLDAILNLEPNMQ